MQRTTQTTEECFTRPTQPVVCGSLGFNCVDNDTYQLCYQPDEDGQTDAPEAEHRCPATTRCDEENPVFCSPIDMDLTTAFSICNDEFAIKQITHRIRKQNNGTQLLLNKVIDDNKKKNLEEIKNIALGKGLDTAPILNASNTEQSPINGKDAGVVNLDNSTRVLNDTEGEAEEEKNVDEEPHDVDDNDALENDLQDENCTTEVHDEYSMSKDGHKIENPENATNKIEIAAGNKTKFDNSWQLDNNCSVKIKQDNNGSVEEDNIDKTKLKNNLERQVPLTTVECDVEGGGETTIDSTLNVEEQCLRTTESTTQIYECLVAGRFADPTNCSWYYDCDYKYNGEGLRACHVQCPYKRIFDKKLKACVLPGSTRNTRGTNDNIPGRSFSKRAIALLNCPSGGKHPDNKDCTLFYFCRTRRDGSISETHIKCPDGTAFDPYRKICSKLARYKCIHRLNSIRNRRDAIYKEYYKGRLFRSISGNEDERSYQKFKRKIDRRDLEHNLISKHVEDPTNNVRPIRQSNGIDDKLSENDNENIKLKDQKRANLLFNNYPELSDNNMRGKSNMANIINSFKERNIYDGNSYLSKIPRDVMDLQNEKLENNNVDKKLPKKFVCSSDGRYPNPQNSHMYYLCFGNTLYGTFSAISLKCPEGSVFSADLQGCVHKEPDAGLESNLVSPIAESNPLT